MNVLRLGGNSRNEDLAQYSIVEMKKKYKVFMPKQYWDLKKNLEYNLHQFEKHNIAFMKLCNVPIIT